MLIFNIKTTLLLSLFLMISFPVKADHYQHKNSISIHLSNAHNVLHVSYALPYKYKNHHYSQRKYASNSRYLHKHKYQHKHYHRNKFYHSGRDLKYKKYSPLKKRYHHAGHYQYKKHCHPVNKTVTSRSGYRHKIGGTQCYNQRGQAYIVLGSRYKIR